MRIVGSLMVVFATVTVCVKLHFQLVNRYREWSLLDLVLNEFCRNNRYQQVVVGQVFTRLLMVLPKDSGVYGETLQCKRRLDGMEESLQCVWKDYVEGLRKRIHFSPGLTLSLLELGMLLPAGEEASIDHGLQMLMEQADEERKQFAFSMKRKRTTGASVAALTGVVTILLFL